VEGDFAGELRSLRGLSLEHSSRPCVQAPLGRGGEIGAHALSYESVHEAATPRGVRQFFDETRSAGGVELQLDRRQGQFGDLGEQLRVDLFAEHARHAQQLAHGWAQRAEDRGDEVPDLGAAAQAERHVLSSRCLREQLRAEDPRQGAHVERVAAGVLVNRRDDRRRHHLPGRCGEERGDAGGCQRAERH
jgi:hypothetical protein